MQSTPVLIVGAGPIGLTASILLKQQGIEVVVIDEKRTFGDHPRARFLDSCTLELFREIGIANAVEASGIGPSWTKTVNCFTTLAAEPIAKTPSPEFHSVPRAITPQVPVMTCQDLFEPILAERAVALGVDLRLGQSFVALSDNSERCRVEIKDTDSGKSETVAAQYVIGCDGVHSPVRDAIGAALEGEVRNTFYRDVLFHADLSPWLDAQDNQGSLLWLAHPLGAGMYQPLDGKQRFRAQIAGLDPEVDYDDEFFTNWIRSSIGSDNDFPIDIFSKLIWRVSAQIVDRFRVGRVMLAGDAAHVFAPTGGMGMNTAFAGVRNLAWKLAYVLKGWLPDTALDTYHSEWKPQATWRSAVALENHDYIVGVYRAFFSAGKGTEELDQALAAFEQYTDYPGVIFGYRVGSELVAGDAPAESAQTVRAFEPAVRPGCRLPHLWLDAAQTHSLLDHCGREYLLVLTPTADNRWESAAQTLRDQGVPLLVQRLTPAQVDSSVYAQQTAVLVRPDLIVTTNAPSGQNIDPTALLGAAFESFTTAA